MSTGTAPPPSSDLIDRFNAIIDDVLACVAVESMKAAGVPWVLRMILAPLVRRRLARWSAAFSAIVADARAGCAVAQADKPALEPAAEHAGEHAGERAADLAAELPEPGIRCRVMPGTARSRFAVGRRAGGRRAEGLGAEGGLAEGGLAEGGLAEGGLAEGGLAEGGEAGGGFDREVADPAALDTPDVIVLPTSRATLLGHNGHNGHNGDRQLAAACSIADPARFFPHRGRGVFARPIRYVYLTKVRTREVVRGSGYFSEGSGFHR